jgi:hypothetical protein
VKRLYFRGDAAFASPEMYDFLEAEEIGYTIRLPANSILQSRIGYLLKRPVGRPPHEVRRHFASFSYQAQSWNKPRRVVAKVEWHLGELYPRVGFIITDLARPAERVVAFYNGRGTAEQWIKEGKGAIKWTRLSCRTFAANAVRLQLQDRCQGRQPRPLRDIPDGRGCSAATDVRRHSVADRSAAGTARTGMIGVKNNAGCKRQWRRCALMPANEVHLAFGCSQPPVRSPSVRGQREFSLPERVNGAILSPRRTESGECRFKRPAGHDRSGGVSALSSIASVLPRDRVWRQHVHGTIRAQ